MIQVAFFDSKDYDIQSFSQKLEGLGLKDQIAIEFFEVRLLPQTANLIDDRFDVVCSFVNDQINAQVISVMKQKGIRLLALRCAGFNHVDMKAAMSAQLPVVRVPAYSPHAIAEHALSLVCALNRKTHKAYQRVRDGNFSIQGLVGFDFYGKTAGIIGTGRIGQAMTRIMQGLGMQVLAYDLYPNSELDVNYVSLEELCRSSDVISLHCPLTEETKYVIDYDTIAMMKPSVLIINTSRGALVNTQDLIYALKKDRIGGAGLDVYEEEEKLFFEDHSLENLNDEQFLRLVSFNNVIVTSHHAFLTHEALEEIASTTVSSILEYCNNQKLNHAVTI